MVVDVPKIVVLRDVTKLDPLLFRREELPVRVGLALEEVDEPLSLPHHRDPDVCEFLDVLVNKFASRKHVIALLIWHSGMRLGTLRSIDVGDFDEDAQLIRLRHRPETGTPLKNKRAAERSIVVSEKYCLVISDYIEHSRHDVQDEYGREPLITSAQGRLTPTPIRNDVYRMTQPCFSGECPHD